MARDHDVARSDDAFTRRRHACGRDDPGLRGWGQESAGSDRDAEAVAAGGHAYPNLRSIECNAGADIGGLVLDVGRAGDARSFGITQGNRRRSRTGLDQGSLDHGSGGGQDDVGSICHCRRCNRGGDTIWGQECGAPWDHRADDVCAGSDGKPVEAIAISHGRRHGGDPVRMGLDGQSRQRGAVSEADFSNKRPHLPREGWQVG